VACLCNVVLLAVLAAPLGALGAAIATFVGNLLASNLNLLFLSRVFAVPARQFYGLRRSDIAILRRAAGGLRSRARGGSR
jgi:hypothetical protein